MTFRGVLMVMAAMGFGVLCVLQSSGTEKHLASAAMLAGVSLLAFWSLAGSLRIAYLRTKPPGLYHNSALLARERLMRPS